MLVYQLRFKYILKFVVHIKIMASLFILQECQRDLASVLPALQSAIDALDSLDKADISEIR